MKIKKYIEKILESGKKDDIECLSDMFDKLIVEIKEEYPEKYKEYKTKLCGMAYDYQIDEEMAYEIVENMKPLGEKWDIDTLKRLKNQYGLGNIRDWDFYVVMNGMANDYNNVIPTDEIETYVKLTKAFILDEDAEKNKVWKYYTTIVK